MVNHYLNIVNYIFTLGKRNASKYMKYSTEQNLQNTQKQEEINSIYKSTEPNTDSWSLSELNLLTRLLSNRWLTELLTQQLPSIWFKSIWNFNKWCWDNWIPTWKRMKLDTHFIPYTNINQKWILDLKLKAKIIKLLEKKHKSKPL